MIVTIPSDNTDNLGVFRSLGDVRAFVPLKRRVRLSLKKRFYFRMKIKISQLEYIFKVIKLSKHVFKDNIFLQHALFNTREKFL